MTPGDSGGAGARWRLVVLVALVLVSVVAAVVLVTVFVQRTDADEGSLTDRVSTLFSGDDPEQAERDVVMSQARQFMLRLNTYGPDLLAEDGTMPEYRSGVEEVITPKFRASFEQGVVAAEQTVSAAGVARTTEVFATGVSSIDADSARVLVAGSFVNSYPASVASGRGGGRGGGGGGGADDERVQDEPAPFRVEVSLVRTGGEWLVDDFVPVTAEGSEDGTNGEAPQELPSEGAPTQDLEDLLPEQGGGNGGGNGGGGNGGGNGGGGR